MAKPSVKSWSDARLLFESGKSLGEISNATGLDKGNISKKAKSEGWQKAVLQPLVASMTRDAAEFTTLLQPQQQLVVKQVEKNLRYMGLRDDVIDIAFTRIKKKGGTWVCQCRRFVGIGDRPVRAYLDWIWRKSVLSNLL